jgi:hypothetical protein
VEVAVRQRHRGAVDLQGEEEQIPLPARGRPASNPHAHQRYYPAQRLRTPILLRPSGPLPHHKNRIRN